MRSIFTATERCACVAATAIALLLAACADGAPGAADRNRMGDYVDPPDTSAPASASPASAPASRPATHR